MRLRLVAFALSCLVQCAQALPPPQPTWTGFNVAFNCLPADCAQRLTKEEVWDSIEFAGRNCGWNGGDFLLSGTYPNETWARNALRRNIKEECVVNEANDYVAKQDGPATLHCSAVPNSSLTGNACACDANFLEAGNSCSGAKNNGSCTVGGPPSIGNPCNPANGNKLERQLVYRGAGGFEFVLTFNTFDYSGRRFSPQWRDSFDRAVVLEGAHAMVYRPDGKVLRFVSRAGGWATDGDTNHLLVELQDPPGTRSGWRLTTDTTDETESYDAAGKLLAISSRSGETQTLAYSDGLLVRASDHFGRALSLEYDSDSRVVRLTDPGGGAYRFGYAGTRLVSITFPDDKVRRYLYNEAAHTGGVNLPQVLTGIVDENESRLATFKYDAQRRAVLTEHAGGAMRYGFVYGAGSTTVVDPLGAARTYGFHSTLGAFKNSAISGPACPGCGPAAQSFDGNGNVASRTDWNGNRTDYAYDFARNLETSRTEALTATGYPTPQTRTITSAWHPQFRLPTQIAEPLRITTSVYDADGTACGARGALCSRTVQATNDANGAQGLAATPVGTPRTWTYTYDAIGSMLTLDGPRTDAPDVTTYTYHPDGTMATLSNAAGHTTRITEYDAHGQPLTVIDANGLATTMTYDERQRLKTRSVGTELTSYDYDGVGQLTKVTLPDGSFLSYSYDAAHRLTGMQDNQGNRIAYTLDAMGNRTQEQVFDPANQRAQTRSRVYSNLNRLFQALGAQGQATEYAYDDQGNVISVKDPLDHVTASQYDALNRLRQVTDAGLGVTRYAYNGLDALTQVTDPRSLVTGYSLDGLGSLTLQSSPDTGNTASTYDAAGNLRTQTDANGQVTAYDYDALNRVTLITFHDGSKQAYAYDQGASGIGRLSSISENDPAGQTTSVLAYAYDAHGRVTAETRTVAGVQYVLGYSYDSAGRLTGLTYPSGRSVTYAFDTLGRVSAVSTAKQAQAQPVLSDVAYHPFGGVKSFTLGNGQSYSRSYDQDGRISSYTLGATLYAIGYDAASRIAFISDAANPINTNTYGYDALDRLTSAVLPGTPFAYDYDAVGNRSSRTVGSATETLDYSPTSNRIASLKPASGPVRSFVFDANGSTIADGLNTYAYDARGRMTQATGVLGTTTYQVNALGQRVRKTGSQGDTVFHYDTRGRLIAETGPGGAVKRELIYLGDMPVAVAQ